MRVPKATHVPPDARPFLPSSQVDVDASPTPGASGTPGRPPASPARPRRSGAGQLIIDGSAVRLAHPQGHEQLAALVARVDRRATSIPVVTSTCPFCALADCDVLLERSACVLIASR